MTLSRLCQFYVLRPNRSYSGIHTIPWRENSLYIVWRERQYLTRGWQWRHKRMCVCACGRVRDSYDVISAVLFTRNPVIWLVGLPIVHWMDKRKHRKMEEEAFTQYKWRWDHPKLERRSLKVSFAQHLLSVNRHRAFDVREWRYYCFPAANWMNLLIK